jgi:transposase-like protein
MRNDDRLAGKMFATMLEGVSTRRYERVVPRMAEHCGVKRSSVSEKFVELSAAQLKELCERRLESLRLLVLYIDGVHTSGHAIIGVVGVDAQGNKHVLGLREGATENAVVVKELLQDLVKRGLDPNQRRLFVIDGSKALRSAIESVFGAEQPVQRCRQHKIENVLGHLPDELRPQVRQVMRAAYKLEDADAGMAKLQQQAKWLYKEYPGAADSLLEGLAETFTVNRLGLPASLRRCLGTTNIIESSFSGVRDRSRRVTRWQDGDMILRWTAAGILKTAESFRKIMGYQDLWMLEAALQPEARKETIKAA